MDDRDWEFLNDAREDEPEQDIEMQFTEHELLELVTAVADQKTYYAQAVDTTSCKKLKRFYRDKLALNCSLYATLQAALAASETAEKL